MRTCATAVVLAGAVACSGDGTAPSMAKCDVSLAVGAYVALDPAGTGGHACFGANAAGDSAEYLLVPQSAAGSPGQSSPFQLRGATAAPVAPSQRLLAARWATSSAVQFDAMLRRLAATGAYAVPRPTGLVPSRAVAAGPPAPGSLRTFLVCAKLDCSMFQHVAARAQSVGARIAIYVDTLAPAGGLDSADLDTLTQLFDQRLFPLDTATFGGVSDIDGNGVVAVLMTGVVNALVTSGQCATSGYVAGFFFAGDLDPVFASQYNNGEVFYSIVADPSGTLSCSHSVAAVKQGTPLTFTHELQHMISFVQHVRVLGGPAEEGWLDEGLSKYAEELAGRSFLPGDSVSFGHYVFDDLYDGYQYLAAPGDSPLLIPYDNGTLAEIGASWLFTRYVVDQFGGGLPRQLHQTRLVGSAAVAAVTGQPFTTVVTRWALANWASALPGFVTPPELTYTSWNFRTTYASLSAQDPADFPFSFPLIPTESSGSAVAVGDTLRSGSGVYIRAFQPPGGAGFTLSFTRDGAAAVPAAVAPRLNVLRIR
ncbi:MAG TPA: hypothetical protein VMH88_14010 [Gemmatimonadales bacterium]|nr:hypothetical protein [Gemmatimonadales bacterium]